VRKGSKFVFLKKWVPSTISERWKFASGDPAIGFQIQAWGADYCTEPGKF
jgi:hypothetical protein